jgi:hypothetical protein
MADLIWDFVFVLPRPNCFEYEEFLFVKRSTDPHVATLTVVELFETTLCGNATSHRVTLLAQGAFHLD